MNVPPATWYTLQISTDYPWPQPLRFPNIKWNTNFIPVPECVFWAIYFAIFTLGLATLTPWLELPVADTFRYNVQINIVQPPVNIWHWGCETARWLGLSCVIIGLHRLKTLVNWSFILLTAGISHNSRYFFKEKKETTIGVEIIKPSFSISSSKERRRKEEKTECGASFFPHFYFPKKKKNVVEN